MFVLGYNISINGKLFKGVNNVQIKRSISKLVGTATIKLPATAVMSRTDGTRANVLTAAQVKRGDTVNIELGYDGKMKKEFSGYVSRVNLTEPLQIECVDGAFNLVENSIAKTYKDSTLDAVLKDLTEGTGIQYDTGGLTINIKKLILATKTGDEVTRLTALEHVISTFGLVAYFDTDGALFVGLRQGKKAGTVKYRLDWNVIKDDQLKKHDASDTKLKIKAIYIDPLGVRTEVTVGDSSGAARTVFLTNVEDKSQLKTLAENELEKYKYDGFEGKFTAFLQPFCEPGYIINLTDEKYQERSGEYYCQGVEVNFGINGARRTIEIGGKV